MAKRARPLSVIHWMGAAFAGLIALAVLVPLGAVMARADWPPALGPADLAAIRFTLMQAALSRWPAWGWPCLWRARWRGGPFRGVRR